MSETAGDTWGARSAAGDLLRALHALGPVDAATRDRIAAMMRPADAALDPSATGGGASHSASRRSPTPPQAAPLPASLPVRDVGAARASVIEEGGGELAAGVVEQIGGGAERGRPAWMRGEETRGLEAVMGTGRAGLQGSAPPDSEGAAAKMPGVLSLFDPARSRAILGAAAATVGEAEVDVPALVEHVARGLALARVPVRTAPTLAHGVQVLVDRGVGMRPFSADVEQLLGELRRVVGESRVDVMGFEACPLRGCGRGPKFMWEAYDAAWLPRRGGRVLCVTDLGIGPAEYGESPASAAEWDSFACMVEGGGCSLGVVTPYPRDRAAPALAARLELIGWDRSTTAAGVAKRLRRRG